jgi:hypothetical protein
MNDADEGLGWAKGNRHSSSTYIQESGGSNSALMVF